MVGSPGKTAEHLAEDFQFIRELQPEMVGIGPLTHTVTHHLRKKYREVWN